ncbi:hypothetical protein ACRALDRAFT_1062732 [Sodiomyces alcalophilus JCM 7366]|uniref:uncharacterized protein n=1 Tax=Sodiomyces alcalophilus JCM 7366 TaxID=591952 RepID=UPI0039B6AF3E
MPLALLSVEYLSPGLIRWSREAGHGATELTPRRVIQSLCLVLVVIFQDSVSFRQLERALCAPDETVSFKATPSRCV